MMESDQEVESDVEMDVCRKADFSLRISEKISTINKNLAVVTKLRKLKDDSAINETLFEDMERDDILKLTVNLVNQLIDVKVLLKDSRTILEDIDTIPSVQPTPQISSQITSLQNKLDEFKTYKPPAPVINYALLASKLPKQLAYSSAMTSQIQAKENAEIEARSSNIMIYNCLISNKGDPAKDAAVDYFNFCNIPSFSEVWRDVVDAKFLKVAEDGMTGTVRATMKSPLIVNSILKDAKLLKGQSGQYVYPDNDDDQYYYQNSYITMDRTISQQEERRKLVTELKMKIATDSSKKWIIRFGKVIAVGDFQT